jgi:hypothetical protein
MPTALSDPTTTFYVILGAITVIFGAIALRRQKRSDLINFAIPAVALVALFVIDRMVESPREQAVRKIQEMGTASRDKKFDELFKHVSDSFKHKSLDKKGLRELANSAEGRGFGGIAEYDLARSGFKEIDANTIEQGFRVKHNGTPELHFYVYATFKKEADGEWRLTTFELADPVNVKDKKDLPVP